MQKITPFLWLDNQAEDAANFYVSLFKSAKIHNVSRYPEGAPGPAGTAMVVDFELEGQRIQILNGGPHFKLSEAFSFSVICEDQAEVDKLWNAMTKDGGEESQCGWLKDKFGVSWQIVPKKLLELQSQKDAKKAAATTQAVLKMRKLDIAELERASAAA